MGSAPLRRFSQFTIRNNSRIQLSQAKGCEIHVVRLNPNRPLLKQSIRQFCTANEAPSSFQQASKAVKWWMTGCTALAFGIIIVGGITRLTESGLSMVDWKFGGETAPRTQEEWEEEFNKYKQFPEFKRLFPDMTVEEFKGIYFWEYLHRMWGRAIGVCLTAPMIYFAATKQIHGALLRRSLLLTAGVGCQGLIGWWMVKSGLEEPENPTAQPRVSQYRLATHLGTALVLYSGMLWTTLDLWFPNKSHLLGQVSSGKFRFFRRGALGLVGLVFTTAASGAFLAGLDGGLAYNMYPLMEEGRFKAENAWNLRVLQENFQSTWQWIKDNLFENTAGVQFNHRILALTTAGSIAGLYAYSSKFARYLPKNAQLARHALLAVVSLQVTLGICTLLWLVPVELASPHQAGSVALLSTALWVLHSLRRIRL